MPLSSMRFTELGLGTSLKAACLAALLAALLATAWHQIATEPLIDQAIVLEGARAAAEHPDAAEEPEVVSRSLQKVGLGLAYLLYGLTWAFILGATFFRAQEILPGRTPALRAGLLGLTAFWAVALLPSLKYPANPPGVGDPNTLDQRQALYFGLIAIAVLGALAAWALWRTLRARRPADWLANNGGWLALGLYAVLCLAAALVLAPNSDPTPVPPDLLFGFRAFSILGHVVFWGTFSAAFGTLVHRWSTRPAQPRQRAQPAPAPGPLRS